MTGKGDDRNTLGMQEDPHWAKVHFKVPGSFSLKLVELLKKIKVKNVNVRMTIL